VSLTQLLGTPDFTIPNGSTSPAVDLFDFALGPNAPPGSYPVDAVLQDSFGNTSDVVTVTEVVVSEPSYPSVFIIGALLCLVLRSLHRSSQRAKKAIWAVGSISLAPLALMSEPLPSYGADTPVIFVTSMPGISPEGSTILHSALPIVNNGAATAEKVLVTSIQLRGGVAIGPAPPAILGSIPPGSRTTLLADFAGASFIPDGRYLMTVSGTYTVGATTFGFTLNRELTIPSPRAKPVRTITTPTTEVSGGGFPQGSPANESDVSPGYPIPHGPASSIPPPALQPIEIVTPAIAPSPGETPLQQPRDPSLQISINQDVADDAFDLYGGGDDNSPREPSGAVASGGEILVTYNRGATYSKDGVGFTVLFPGDNNTAPFPNADGGFCCDQVVQYAPPPIDRFIWLLQYGFTDGSFPQNRIRMAIAPPGDLNFNPTHWTYTDFTSADYGDFGDGSKAWLDQPDMSVGDNYLYVSFSLHVGERGDGVGLVVCRTPLSEIGAIPGLKRLTLECTGPDPVTAHSHLSQHTANTVFWAGHLNDSTIRVFSWSEGFAAPDPPQDVQIWSGPKNEGKNEGISAIDPDGVDWLQYYRCGQNLLKGGETNSCGVNTPAFTPITGATRIKFPLTDELVLAWTGGVYSSSLGGFTRPHVEMVVLNVNNNLQVLEGHALGFNDGAVALPAVLANDLGEIGISLEGQVDGQYQQHFVGILGTQFYQSTHSDISSNRYGDFVTIRPSGCAFDAFGYGQYFAAGPELVFVDIHRVNFNSDQCSVSP